MTPEEKPAQIEKAEQIADSRNRRLTWYAFHDAHPSFNDSFHKAFKCLTGMLESSTEAGPSREPVITGLSLSLIDDIDCVMTLCWREKITGAHKLLRTVYERVVTVKYLAQNPATVSDFVDYTAVHWRKFVTAFANGDHSQLERWPVLRDAYLNVKDRFREEKCPQCNRTPPSSWTKLSTDAMARQVGMIDEYTFCFLVPTLLLHATHWGNERTLHGFLEPDDSTLSNILLALHRLLIEAIWIFQPFSNISVASDVIGELVDDFGTVWGEAASGS